MPTLDSNIDDLTESQAKFILKALMAAGHVPEYVIAKAIELSGIIVKGE